MFRKYFGTEAASFVLYLGQKYSRSVGAVKKLATSIRTFEDSIDDLVLMLLATVPGSLTNPRLGLKPTQGHRSGDRGLTNEKLVLEPAMRLD